MIFDYLFSPNSTNDELPHPTPSHPDPLLHPVLHLFLMSGLCGRMYDTAQWTPKNVQVSHVTWEKHSASSLFSGTDLCGVWEVPAYSSPVESGRGGLEKSCTGPRYPGLHSALL